MKVKPGWASRTAAIAFGQNGSGVRPQVRWKTSGSSSIAMSQRSAVAMPGNRRQLRHLRRLQRRIGIVELQRVRPAGEIGIAPMGQDARTLIGLDPPVIAGGRRQIGLAALDIEIGMGPDPGMIERRVVGHEIEHQPQAARGEPGAEAGQRRLPAQMPHRPRRRRWRSPIRDIVLGQIGQRRLAIRRARPGCWRDTARLCRADLPHAQQPDPVEAVAREIIEDVRRRHRRG